VSEAEAASSEAVQGGKEISKFDKVKNIITI